MGATDVTQAATPLDPVQNPLSQHQNVPQTPSQQAPATHYGTGLGIKNTSQAQSQSINTRLWQALNGFAREQENGGNSGGSSKLPSTAVPSVIDEAHAGSSQAPNSARQFRSMAPPLNIPSALANEARGGDNYSATEVATPSVRGSPDFRVQPNNAQQARRILSPCAPQQRHSPQNAGKVSSVEANGQRDNIGRRTTSAGPSLSIQEMCNTIHSYGRRIDQLESMSFAHLPSDEVLDRFDMVDGRLLDLEQWRTEQDKAGISSVAEERFESFQNRVLDLEQWRDEQDTQPFDESNSARESRMRHSLPDASSFASDESFDSNAAAQTETIVLATLAANAETGPRIDALESRITELEGAAMPSYIRPWHVQVVLLPFGRRLPGIWFSSTESSRQSMRRSASRASEEWSGPLDYQFAAKSSFQSDASEGGAWTTASIEEWAKTTQGDWLSAKACGPGGTVFQRLDSRGMVRDIEITSPDAHSIWEGISDVFGSVLGIDYQAAQSDTTSTAKYHALKQPFIPLRKVRKSSRLRFLSSHEMLTPALWTAGFLDSNVMMKLPDGHRRLYLTTPEAYIQPSPSEPWSWPALRNLPMYGADGKTHAAQVVGNVIEACWSYNDRLDQHAASLHSSFAEQISIWDEDNDAEPLPYSVPMTKPRSTDSRSASMPNADSPPEAPVLGQPILSSSPPIANISLLKRRDRDPESQHQADKRRRISSHSSRNSSSSAMPLSPELRRGGVNFTPRWSREPPSPFTAAQSANIPDMGNTAGDEDHGILLGRRGSQGAFSAGEDENEARERSSSWMGSRGRGASGTPFAYATPHSGVLDDVAGDREDTEVESEAGSESSWPGWDDGAMERI
jgi:hypothetical protein